MKHFSKKLLSLIMTLIMVATMLPSFAITANASSANSAIADYTAKINNMYNGTVYTNTLPAYVAYLAAVKNSSTENLTALANAVDEMTAFTPYSASGVAKVNTEDSNYNSGVIYSPSASETYTYADAVNGYLSASYWTVSYKDDVFVYQPSAVLLYDGTTTPKIPVLFAEQSRYDNWCLRYNYVSESGGRLIGPWYGHSTAGGSYNSAFASVNLSWPSSTAYQIPKIATEDASSDDGYVHWDANNTSSGGHGKQSDFYNFKNALAFTIDGGSSYTSISDNDEYEKISGIKKFSKFEWNIGAYFLNTISGNPHNADGDLTLNTTNPVYVINYKKLIDKITITLGQKKETFINLDDTTVKATFDNGNAMNFFAAFDEATGLDVTDSSIYDYATDMEEAADKAAQKINDVCDDLYEITGSAGGMSVLVNAINQYEANMMANPYRKNLASTYELYLKAKECFDAYIFGQKNDTVSDADFLSYLENIATEFETAVTKSTVIMENGEADLADGNYTPDDGIKFFDTDTYASEAAVTAYKAEGAMNNVLYFPTVTKSNGVRAQTTEGTKTDSASRVYNGKGDGDNHFELFYPSEVVLLYNGESNAVFPVMCTMRSNHGFGGAASYHTAAYPTDSATLLSSSSTYMRDVEGYHSQGSWSDGYYPNLSSGYTYINVRSSTKGPHAPEVSSNFKITSFANSYSYGSGNNYSHTNQHWKGFYKDGNTGYNLNWFQTWGSVARPTDISDSGAMYGSPNEWWSRYYNIDCENNHSNLETSIGATAVEYSNGSYFENYTGQYTGTNDSDSLYAKTYSGPNWYHSWAESQTGGTALAVEVLSGSGNIRVINTEGLAEKLESLASNTDIQNKLKYIFEYDNDSADMITLMQKIDAVGSFDPNNYFTSSYMSGKTVDTCVTNCVNDIKAAIGSIDEATDAAEDIDTADTSKESTSTQTNAEGLDNDSWYNNLRKALLNPLKSDSCSSPSAYSAYTHVLGIAQDAVAYSAMSKISGGAGSDYPTSYTYTDDGQSVTKTIEELVTMLEDAEETFKSSGMVHTYKYADEDDDQISDWECTANSSHSHDSADMSAYNELALAYGTLDPEAYTSSAVTALRTAKSGSFDSVKTTEFKEGESSGIDTPQDYVDDGVSTLLETINTVSSSSSNFNDVTTRVYVVCDGDEENKTEITDMGYNEGYTTSYGTLLTLDATKASNFPIGGECYKWTVKQTSGNVQTISAKSNTLTSYVQNDCEVTAYVNTPSPTGKVKVSVNGPTGALIYELYVTDSTNIEFGTVSDNAIAVTIGGKEYTISSTTSYNVTGVTIGSSSTDYSGQTKTVAELLEASNSNSLVIKPIKSKNSQASSKTYTITANGHGGTINRNVAQETTTSLSDIAYDEKIRVEYDNSDSDTFGSFYGIAVNISASSTAAHYVPITYDNIYYFRAVRNMTFYPLYCKSVTSDGTTVNTFIVDDGTANGAKITNSNDKFRLNRHLPFVIDFMDNDNISGKFVFRVAFTTGLPDNVKVTEHGWTYFYYKNDDQTTFNEAIGVLSPTESDVYIGNTLSGTVKSSGNTYSVDIRKQAASKNYNNESHQYSFSSSKKTSGYAYVLARGYIKYTYTFTQGGTSAPLEAVEYGSADSYSYPENS